MAHRAQPLENLGSLITYKDGDADRALGYLMPFEGHGVYDPTFGKVAVSPEQAEIHNRLLDEALLSGLDRNCEIGMGGTFYAVKEVGRPVVKTWIGTLVSDECAQHGRSLTFKRGGKTYRGITAKSDGHLFNFKRIA